MPRWLIASVIAFVLSCCGFAAVAHSSSSRDHGGTSLAQLQHEQPVHEAPANDAEDASALHDDVHSDCTDAVPGGFQAFLTVFASGPVPQPAMTATPSPFLAQPKRPPRGTFIL